MPDGTGHGCGVPREFGTPHRRRCAPAPRPARHPVRPSAPLDGGHSSRLCLIGKEFTPADAPRFDPGTDLGTAGGPLDAGRPEPYSPDQSPPSVRRLLMHNAFTAIFERDGDWYLAYCPEIPGANGQGKTKEEARASLAEAIALILHDRREDALRGTPPDAERETVTVD